MERRLTLQIFSRCGIRVAVVANEQSVERIAYRPCSVRSGKFETGSIECRPARTATALRERGMEALRQRRQRAATTAQQGGIKLRSEREVVIVDRKSVGWGKGVSERVDLGGVVIIKKTNTK